jgi:hypothetical protein
MRAGGGDGGREIEIEDVVGTGDGVAVGGIGVEEIGDEGLGKEEARNEFWGGVRGDRVAG